MTTQVYCSIHYEDGRTVNAKWIGDALGVRVYAIVESKVQRIEAFPGATITDRVERNRTHTISLTGVDEPVPFSLEFWGGCHCGSKLKAFRAPTSWETP